MGGRGPDRAGKGIPGRQPLRNRLWLLERPPRATPGEPDVQSLEILQICKMAGLHPLVVYSNLMMYMSSARRLHCHLS